MESVTPKSKVDQIEFLCSSGKSNNSIPHFLHRFFPEKPNNCESSKNVERLNLSLNLSVGGLYSQIALEEVPLTRASTSPGGLTVMADKGVHCDNSDCLNRSSSVPVEAERALVRFGDLQMMRRAETGKRWLQDRLMRTAEATAVRKSPVAVTASKVAATSPAAVKLTILDNPSVGSSKDEVVVMDDSSRVPYTGTRNLADVGANSNVQTSSNKGKEIVYHPKPITMVLPPSPPANTRLENQPKRPKLMPLEPCGLRYEDLAVLSRMPSVSTTGDGPNGKRIKGFLYTYRGGQISIVCVCHGRFMSPEEFVKHAGRNDVTNAMKHITVCSNPF